jgi:hypothetical protein
MEEREIVSIIEQEISQSIGHWDGSLASEREQELKSYLGEPYGNEVEGESQVVSTDVADTVEGILPSVLRTFTSSDDAVRFDPNGPEDEDEAQQQTEVCNYVFYRQNNGFLVMYEWVKDALIQKNGIVKYWWEDKFETKRESYQGLTEGQYMMLKQDEGVEFVEQKFYDDPAALKQKEMLREQLASEITALPKGQQKQALAILDEQLNSQKLPQMYDCVLDVTKDVSKVCIKAIPPEEFGISSRHNCVSIQETDFCYHRTRRRISELRAEECPEEILADISGESELDISPESLARDRFLDNQWQPASSRSGNDASKDVWVVEAFIRLDEDGDGIAELRHIIMVGRKIWIDEETEHVNFAAITPVIMPHRWTGRSIAELVGDNQFTKTVLWRQMLTNLYLTNNPRKAVLSSAGGIVQANLDDLLTSRPGGIMREYTPGAIRNEEIPFVAEKSFPMLEYIDGVNERRTGLTRYTQGLDPDSLNKTARGISMIQSAGQQRLDLISRIIAETGVKDLFRGIVYMLSKYSSKEMTIKLRNKWVDVDPRGWKTQYNMTVNVGLGTGNRDVELAHLRAIHEMHMELMQTGRAYMVTDENIFNTYTKMTQAMGYKHPELFITDPRSIPPEAKQPPPPAELIKIQAESQEAKAKLEFGQQKELLNAETLKAVEQIKAQAMLSAHEMDNATKERIAGLEVRAQAELAVFDKSNSLERDKNEIEKKSLQLENKETQIGAEEQLLQIKKNLDSIVQGEKEKVSADNDGKLAEHTSSLMQTVMTGMSQIGKELGNIAKMTDNMAKLTASQVQMSKDATKERLKPRSVKVENLQIGKDGIITGATLKGS